MAALAPEGEAEHRGTAVLGGHPGPLELGRMVAQVAGVSAGEHGGPVALRVGLRVHERLRHHWAASPYDIAAEGDRGDYG